MSWPDKDRWEALMRAVGAAGTTSDWYEWLTRAYAEPQRYYHNQQHIAECLVELDQARHLARQIVTVELALWFHDAVYDPKAGDNEEKSAELANWCFRECGIADSFAGRVSQLVMVTKNHETGSDADAQLMVDIDLSILGRDEKRFNEYEEQIRQEYAWVPQEVFGLKRAEVLQRFLDRPYVFATHLFRQKYEEQARMNLKASIQNLQKMSK